MRDLEEYFIWSEFIVETKEKPELSSYFKMLFKSIILRRVHAFYANCNHLIMYEKMRTSIYVS